ncbi:MAG: hypothetical protein QOJ19_2784 [Acidimicrobiia bacterium]|nr:hypothetical protein [Acidimicrobiia bacterium]
MPGVTSRTIASPLGDVAGEHRPAPHPFSPLPLGPHRVWPPVVLAPMAGVTNPPFRAVCRSFGGGVFVGEMVSARALVWNDDKTWRKYVDFAPDEGIRSLQLYGVDPRDVGEAVSRLVGEGRVDHLDLNFGCPVAKVTRRGGGAALPLKTRLLAAVVRSAVEHAGAVPVTMKFRIGVDDDLVTFRDAGRIGEDEGCAAVALHARTAAQLYDGEADWSAIAELKQLVRTIPVLGNGDIFEARDALDMMRRTGCDGVVIGRGCLGRPWLFRDLEAVFDGQPAPPAPPFGAVRDIATTHARMAVAWSGERRAIRDFRKHVSWYAKGYRLGPGARRQLAGIETLADLQRLLAGLDPDATVEPESLRCSRAKRSGRQRVALPAGFLDDLDDLTPPAGADDVTSGG